MKMKTLENVSDKDIADYPIAEAELNSSGEVLYDEYGNFKESKQTLTWSIKSGEKVAFPEYVADILLKRFGVSDPESGRCVLTEVVGETTTKIADPKEVAGFVCKGCGKSFKAAKGLGLHLAIKHPELLTK